MSIYRIIKSSYFNEYGKIDRICFYVQVRKKFLGIGYWSDIKHRIGSMSGEFKMRTEFSTYEDASQFVLNLKEGRGYSGWEDEIVKVFN